MKSIYKPIGPYIRVVDERNAGHEVNFFLGLSISKPTSLQTRDDRRLSR